MDVALADRFFALATLTALAGLLGIAVLSIGSRVSPALARADTSLRDRVGGSGYWLAWLVALASLVGSLYYSEIVGYPPCSLCWYQRIAMYPLVVILAVAARRRDRSVVRYVMPLVVIGGLIAGYQYVLGYLGDIEVFGCTLDVSCTERYIWQFGFVDFPFMSLIAFSVIAALMLWAPPGVDAEQ